MGYFALTIILIILDQVVKFWVVEHIPLYHHIDFLPPLMDLTYVQNTGAAFSMLSQHTWALTLVSAFMSVGLSVALYKKFFSQPLGQLALSLVLAGATGNLIDRAFRGFVVDMFNFLFVRFAVFNVADICVVIGGILSAVYYLYFFEKYDMPPEDKEEGTEDGEKVEQEEKKEIEEQEEQKEQEDKEETEEKKKVREEKTKKEDGTHQEEET